MTTPELARFALAFLGTYALHSTLLLAAVWAVCAARPALAPRLRERLWRLGLVGGLLTASAQLVLGARPILGGIVLRPEPHALALAARPEPAPALVPQELAFEREAASGTSAADPEPDRARRERPASPSRVLPTRSAPRLLHERALAARADDARGNPVALETARGPAALDERFRPFTPAPAPERAAPVASEESALVHQIERRARAVAWPALLTTGWALAGGLFALGLVASWAFFRRRLRGRRILVEGPLVERLERLRLRAGLERRVRLSVSERIASPVSLGLFRHEICIPQAVQSELSSAQQESLLAHEVAHALRRDPAWFALYCVLEKLFFFQPLNRLARKNLQELAELACDDWAVRWTGERLALASCLTEVAQWIVGARGRELAVPGLASNRSKLARRVERLLDDRRSPAVDARVRFGIPLFLAVAGVFVLAVPGISASLTPLAPGAVEPRIPLAADGAAPEPALVPPSPAVSPGPASAETRSAPQRSLPQAAPPLEVTSPAPPTAAPTEPGVATDHELLEQEMQLLEDEFDALKHELARSELDERFSKELALIERRMHELRARRERVGALLERLSAPAHAPMPANVTKD